MRKITELKEIDQRVQLGEEQLVALNDSGNSGNSSGSWQLNSLNSSLGSLSEH